MPATPLLHPLRWDLFCRVIDNHGDLGVCWRLACQLADAGQRVRLWVDDARALAWMAPAHAVTSVSTTSPWPTGARCIAVHPFDEADGPGVVAGDVVIEAFGCDPPPAFLARMPRPPAEAAVWLNLEYLSAEPYVERSHGLPSPQWSGPGSGLTKWFFYPGFTAATGGLLSRPGLDSASMDDLASALATAVVPPRSPRADARRISLFCYRPSNLHTLLDTLDDARFGLPVDLLVSPGLPLEGVNAWLRQRQRPPLITPARLPATAGPPTVIREPHRPDDTGLHLHALPYLSQATHDALLSQCDLNVVRGEDSWVTALRSGRPLLWQVYPQDDGAHHAKLEAFLAHYLDGADEPIRAASRALHTAWNAGDAPRGDANGRSAVQTASPDQWRAALHTLLGPTAAGHARSHARRLSQQAPLLDQLMQFVAERRSEGAVAATG